MKNILLPSLIFLSLFSFGQNLNTNDSTDYFSEGLEAFKNNDYLKARTFFLKSYEIKPERNAIYNLGLINLILNDTCSACKYFKTGVEEYSDAGSRKVYNDLCIYRIDTAYYDKKHQLISTPDKYKYFEESIKTKCDSNTIVVIHKSGHNSTKSISSNIINILNTDIFAIYYQKDSDKIYNYIYGYSFYNENKKIIESYKEKLRITLNNKYSLDEKILKDWTLSLKLWIDKNGNITECVFLNNPFNILGVDFEKGIKDEIIFSLKNIKSLKPVLFIKQPVNYQFSLLLDFPIERDGTSYEKAIIIKDNSMLNGIEAEYAWIRKNYPGYTRISQSLTFYKEKPYDIIHIQTKDGKELKIFFDITRFYGKY